jgi:hypothetical protein
MDIRRHGSKSNSFRFVLKHATTGQGLTGLAHDTAGLIISTILDNEASPTVYAQASSNVETITTLGTFAAPTASKCRFREVSSANHKGVYEFQFADARFSVAGAKKMVISVTGAANLADADYEVALTPSGLEGEQIIRSGVLAGGSTAAATLDAGASTTDDQYNFYGLLVQHAATGLLEFRAIADYTGSSKSATLDRAMLEACASGDPFWVIAGATASISGNPSMNLAAIGGSTTRLTQFGRGVDNILTGVVTASGFTPTDTQFRAVLSAALGSASNIVGRDIYWRTGTNNYHKGRIKLVTHVTGTTYLFELVSAMPAAGAADEEFEVL